MNGFTVVGVVIFFIFLFFIILNVFLFTTNKKNITVSDRLGDEVLDVRDINEVAKVKQNELQKKYPNRKITLIHSERVDPNDPEAEKKCPQGVSIAGCFSFTFKVEK